MKKRLIFIPILVVLLLCGSLNSATYTKTLLATAVACGAGATVTNVTDFTSLNAWVSQFGYKRVAAITVTFTRVTGAADDVNFNLESSRDDASTWDSAAYVELSVDTNATADSNVVTKTFQVNVYGITHLRLGSIVNDDSATALTACNVTVVVRD